MFDLLVFFILLCVFLFVCVCVGTRRVANGVPCANADCSPVVSEARLYSVWTCVCFVLFLYVCSLHFVVDSRNINATIINKPECKKSHTAYINATNANTSAAFRNARRRFFVSLFFVYVCSLYSPTVDAHFTLARYRSAAFRNALSRSARPRLG
jgi:fucose permease